MASNPMLNAVLLFQHHQTTTPHEPIQPIKPMEAALPVLGEVDPVPQQPPQPVESYEPGSPDTDKPPHEAAHSHWEALKRFARGKEKI